MSETKIEWASAVWNPTVGCSRVSPGCANCYAFTLHDRRHAAYQAGAELPKQYALPFRNVQLLPDRLGDPLRRRKPARIFVDSMADLFHEGVPDWYLDRVFAAMALAEQHDFVVLTKRPERMRLYVDDWSRDRLTSLARATRPVLRGLPARTAARYELAAAGRRWGQGLAPPFRNIWLGVSVERQNEAGRVDVLRGTPAAVRLISAEPLLGPLSLDLDGIGWLIVGGESGKNARPMAAEWALSLRNASTAAGVPFFFKQWGEHDDAGARIGKRRAGRLLDGVEWSEAPETRSS